MIQTCPGCGVQLQSETDEVDKIYTASKECRNLSHKLSYYTLSLHDDYFIHQLAVDAYAAQHAGPSTKSISTAFALIGLHLVIKHNYTGKEVQKAHMRLAEMTKEWPRFSLPKEKAELTVKHVVDSADEQKNEMIQQWVRVVWEIWKREHQNVEMLVQRYHLNNREHIFENKVK
jgi:hypothetical protein